MNLPAVVLFATQALVWTISPPTVTLGDTVRITRRVSAEPDARSSVLPLVATSAYIPLSAPIAAYSEGAIVIRYQLAFFQTGVHSVSMPDLELSYPDGRVDVVPGDTAWVDVASVLPPERARPPPPRPSLGPIAREQRTLTPAILFVTIIIIGLVSWALLRRRTTERPLWDRVAQRPPDVPLQQWIMAGESKAAVGVISDRLRAAIEQGLPTAGRQLSTQECLAEIEKSRPDWPRRDLEEALRSLDRAQYAPAVPSDVALLVDQVDDLLGAIRDQQIEEADT